MNNADWEIIVEDIIPEIKKKMLHGKASENLELVNKIADLYRILRKFTLPERAKIIDYYNKIDKS